MISGAIRLPWQTVSNHHQYHPGGVNKCLAETEESMIELS